MFQVAAVEINGHGVAVSMAVRTSEGNVAILAQGIPGLVPGIGGGVDEEITGMHAEEYVRLVAQQLGDPRIGVYDLIALFLYVVYTEPGVVGSGLVQAALAVDALEFAAVFHVYGRNGFSFVLEIAGP